jgi:hypothetical protein
MLCREPKGMEMENPFRCPVCNTLMEEDKDAGFKIPPQCPYLDTFYPELCSLHDKLYFGKWRKMVAVPTDIKRAYAKLDRLFHKVQEVVLKENILQARQDLRKACDILAAANPEEEPYASVQHMDQALSYIHHAINDLLKEKQAKLHSPADYEMHYDVVLPFKEDL